MIALKESMTKSTVSSAGEVLASWVHSFTLGTHLSQFEHESCTTRTFFLIETEATKEIRGEFRLTILL